MIDWHISKVIREHNRTRLSPLGIVKAEHQPGALQKAQQQWADQVDWSLPQGGFTARQIEA